MADQSAVNASPLIFLSKAGLMHLLQVSGEEVMVPEPVAREILKRAAGACLNAHNDPNDSNALQAPPLSGNLER